MAETVTLREYVDQRFNDSDKAVQAALVSQEKAIIKAENAAERRFELLNELRGDVATKTELKALEKVIDELKTSRDKGEGKGDAAKYIIGLALALLGIFIGYIIRK